MVQPSRPRTLRIVGAEEASESVSDTDDAIIDAFARGELSCGERLYNHLIGTVESTLYRVLGTRGADHEDLVQSAFEQIVVTLANGKFARSCSLKSWAAAITSNIAFNTVRARTTERKFFDRKPAPKAIESAVWRSDPERDSNAKRDLDRLRTLLSQMSPKLAQTLVLHDALGHDLSEIAILTGVSVAAAQSRLVRGRRTLEQLYVQSGLREDV
jgi:RNA polymerase sigma-70 factor (ECF subfamily)